MQSLDCFMAHLAQFRSTFYMHLLTIADVQCVYNYWLLCRKRVPRYFLMSATMTPNETAPTVALVPQQNTLIKAGAPNLSNSSTLSNFLGQTRLKPKLLLVCVSL